MTPFRLSQSAERLRHQLALTPRQTASALAAATGLDDVEIGLALSELLGLRLLACAPRWGIPPQAGRRRRYFLASGPITLRLCRRVDNLLRLSELPAETVAIRLGEPLEPVVGVLWLLARSGLVLALRRPGCIVWRRTDQPEETEAPAAPAEEAEDAP